jgi:hypothetical protein
MGRPRVSDEEDGFQIGRVAASVLNKQSRTVGRGLGEGLTTPHLKKLITKCYKVEVESSSEKLKKKNTNHQMLIKFQQNRSKQEAIHHVLISTNLG